MTTAPPMPTSEQMARVAANVRAVLEGRELRLENLDRGITMTWEDIPGWFDYEAFYREVAEGLPEDALCVEVGGYLGRSACFLGSLLKARGGGRRLYVIEHGLGSPEHRPGGRFEHTGPPIADTLIDNIVRCGLADTVRPLILPSSDAAGLFADQSIDFCFIDAEHSYNAVLRDLRAWTPKVKPRGVLAGHDYTDDWPGVVAAVNDYFGGLAVSSGSCWVAP